MLQAMWIGHGQANQWPADLFTRNVDIALAEDMEWAEERQMTLDEFRASYLLVLLGVAAPAGNA
jgi:hypothetical protein